MKLLIIRSWFLLFYVECLMRVRDFKTLHQIVRATAVSEPSSSSSVPHEKLCRAMDLACVFYFKHVLCLQRSSALTILLRGYAWPAELVIGAQIIPFKSHAWCEIEGVVVNDKPYMPEIYQVLERC